MDIRLSPAPLSGCISAIPSKSFAHRLLICAALADRATRLSLPSSSQDIDATCRCLTALGAQFTQSGPDEVTVQPIRTVPPAPQLDCGESGSTLRFLLPVAAALSPSVRFTGQGRLPQRPIGPLLDAMQAGGVTVSQPTLPLTTQGQLHNGAFSLPGNISSQYLTGLMLALPLLSGDSTLSVTTPLESSAYLAITQHVLAQFGVQIEQRPNGWVIPGCQTFTSSGLLPVEGDWSNAAFFLAAGALGGPITVTGLDPDSPQGDRAILELLRQFGAHIRVDGSSVTAAAAPLYGIHADVREIPDALPILAVLAAFAQGESRFTGAARLRLKESDRLSTVAAMLRGLGGQVEELPDGLIVRGAGLVGGTVDGANDHRIVMAAAIAACRCSHPVTVSGAQAVQKSYPAFFRALASLGGIPHGI